MLRKTSRKISNRIETVDITREEILRRVIMSAVLLGVLALTIYAAVIIVNNYRADDWMGFMSDEMIDYFDTQMFGERPPIPTSDRAGFPINIRDDVYTIVSLEPFITEIIINMQAGDRLIAADSISANLPMVNSDVIDINLDELSLEMLLNLNADVIFVSTFFSEETIQEASEAGLPVVTIPPSDTLAELSADFLFVATIVDEWLNAMRSLQEVNFWLTRVNYLTEFQKYSEWFYYLHNGYVSEELLDRRLTVYVEVTPAPYRTTHTDNTKIDHMLWLSGARNAFRGNEGIIDVTDDMMFAADPDVIITLASWADDSVGDILSRPGWEDLTAVRDGRVYVLDNNLFTRPNYHNYVRGLYAFLTSIYPNARIGRYMTE